MKPRLGAAVGAAAAVVAIALHLGGVFAPWERTTWDWRVRVLAAPSAATDAIRVILLDQASLDWGSEVNGWSWPWPREVYAPLIDFCRRGGAKSVAFDVIFSEPSVYGVHDDLALADAMARGGDVIGAVFLGERGGVAAWPDTLPRPAAAWPDPAAWRAALRDDRARALLPVPELADAPRLLANVSDRPDPDGVFRAASLVRRFDGAPLPSLALAAATLAFDAPPRLEAGRLLIGDAVVDLDENGAALLAWAGPSGAHATVSAAAVIQSELRLLEGGEPTLDPEFFRGRHVFFGFSAPGLLDERSTPLSPVTPGVEIHATALDNILADGFMRRAPRAAVIPVAALLGLLGAAAVTLCRRARHTVLVFAALLPLPPLLGLLAYTLGFWWPVVVGQASVTLALAGGVMINYATEGRQKKFIKQAFKYYLSPQVIDRILVDPDSLKLGGERRELSIMFSDLAGFTSLSEGLDPRTLTELLNAYLSDMTDIILDEGGTLDKYEGDAFIAFWNAPLPQPDHALRACRAALRCRRKLEERQEAYRAICGRTLSARIGLHSGDVVVGNMGSQQRFDYTVLGDAANLASRLEGANKVFGTHLMISDATRRLAGDDLVCRELALIRVVGRSEPVRVHELVGLSGEENLPDTSRFASALELCRAGRLDEAHKIFMQLTWDAPARAYEEACGEAGPEWDGTWNLTQK